MAGDFIGKGWSFPIRTNATGGIALVSGEQELKDSIRLILETAYGDRPMRPEFGCGIHEYVFAPADPTTAGRLGYEVRASLKRWEPRIEVNDVTVTVDEEMPGAMFISLTYTARETNDRRNLVFPFYVIPKGAER